MIALVITFLGFGLLGLVAYAAVIAAVGLVVAPFIWAWKLARFLVRLAVVLAHAAVAIAVDLFRFVRFVARLTWRIVRFTFLAALHVGGDLARLAR